MGEPLFNFTGFNEYLHQHRIMGSRCLNCGKVFLPPRSMCSNCYASRMEWIPFSGKGTLIGFTTIFIGLSTMIEEGYTRDHPYCSGVVRLEEGPIISGQIIDSDCAHPEELKVGMQVRAAFIEKTGNDHADITLGFERIYSFQRGEEEKG